MRFDTSPAYKTGWRFLLKTRQWVFIFTLARQLRVLIKLSYLPALALLVALSACGAKPAKKPARIPEAGYVTVTAQTVPLEIELPGRTTAYETSDVRPQVSGLIQ